MATPPDMQEKIGQLQVAVAALQSVNVERGKAIDAALVAADKAVVAALAAAEKAVTKAEMASEKRFDSVNEFRATLSDQATQFLPRKEFDVSHADVARQIAELRAAADRTEGAKEQVVVTRSNVTQYSGLLFGIIGVIQTLVIVVIGIYAGTH